MAGQSRAQFKPVFKGDLLLCEDSVINQRIIQSQLSGLGLDVTVAGNGKEGVLLVLTRIKNGEKPFDLIFMDMYMPIVGGLDAADALTALGCRTPMVALSASTKPSDCEVYRAHGMIDSLSKPFTTYELWSCLCRYLTPVRFEASTDEARAEEAAKQRHKLLTGFVKRNQTTFVEICTAIETGDFKLAHRLAHTVAGLAGLMGENALLETARAVEQSLADEELANIKPQLSDFDRELKAVLDALAPLLHDKKPQSIDKTAFDKAKAAELFGRLEPLLQKDNAMSVKLTDELRALPETGDLIALIEDYEFEMALDTLAGLRNSLGL